MDWAVSPLAQNPSKTQTNLIAAFKFFCHVEFTGFIASGRMPGGRGRAHEGVAAGSGDG